MPIVMVAHVVSCILVYVCNAQFLVFINEWQVLATFDHISALTLCDYDFKSF